MVHMVNGGILLFGVVVRFLGVVVQKWPRRRLVRPLVVSGGVQVATGIGLLFGGASVVTMCISALIVAGFAIGLEVWMNAVVKKEKEQRI